MTPTSSWACLRKAGQADLAALRGALHDPTVAQEQLLRRILADNVESAFGRQHEFQSIRNWDDYRQRVPIRDYVGLSPWIERIISGDANALTTEAPFVFELTGGSSGGHKLVPYTRRALSAFRVAILAWLADLLANRPEMGGGRAYFAISPATRAKRQSIGGLPIGLETDAGYLGEDLAPVLSSLLIGVDLGALPDVESWRLMTAAALAASADLSFISVWSPTFLTSLLETMAERRDEIAMLIRQRSDGTERAARFMECTTNERVEAAALWPQLRLVSAWADASSKSAAARLRSITPEIELQPKGLLATEGVFTLPLSGPNFPVPALNSSVLEFEDKSGALHLIDELAEGSTYQLIVTTPGGFYRYRIGDEVKCCGFIGGTSARTPMLTFIGRAGNVADLVGEKIEEAFAAACVATTDSFACLVAIESPPHYVLVVESETDVMRVSGYEHHLCTNPLYADARFTGQLGPLRILTIENAFQRYLAWRVQNGARLGDIKQPALLHDWVALVEFWPELRTPAGQSLLV